MAKKLQPVTCRVCHQAIDRNVEVENIDWVMPSKNYFYHCRCYEDWVQKKNNVKISSQENDDFWRSAAYDYLKRQLKIEVNYPKVLSQWASFVKKGMTSKGIYFSMNKGIKDENKLCKLLVGDCKSYDILLETDPSLGKQVRINYAIFNSKDPLIEKRHEKEKDI